MKDQGRLLTILTPLAIVLIVGGAYLWRDHAQKTARANVARLDTLDLHQGESCYAFVSEVEFAPTQNGLSWDDLPGHEAPDPQYAIRWNGLEVYRSGHRTDTLIARWSIVGVDLAQFSRSIDVNSAIAAARFRVDTNLPLTIQFFDWDALDLLAGATPVLEKTIPVKALKFGPNAIALPGACIARFTLEVLAHTNASRLVQQTAAGL